MYTQTHLLFVDHTKEYPYESKKLVILGRSFEAKKIEVIKPEYMRGSYIPLFGFPHSRSWNEISDYINAENSRNNELLMFITNEDKAFCDNYMDTEYGTGKEFYAIGIKRPTNFVMDYNFSNYGNKKLVNKLTLNNETVVRIYKVSGTKNN
jgi:hypothetical protein